MPGILQDWGEPQSNRFILFIQGTLLKVILLLWPPNAMASLISLILQTVPTHYSLKELFHLQLEDRTLKIQQAGPRIRRGGGGGESLR